MNEDANVCDVCGAPAEAVSPAETVTGEASGAPAETATDEPAEVPAGNAAGEASEAPAGTASKEPAEAPAETAAEAAPAAGETAQVPVQTAGETAEVPVKPAKSKKGVIAAIVAAAVVAVAGIGVFAAINTKKADPKQIVIDAFKTINPEDKVSPMEELFGWSMMPENLEKESNEIVLTVKLDSSSDAGANAYAGAGLRMGVKSDVAAKANLLNAAVLYKDMDLANLNLYTGDETLAVTVPELTGKVFTLKIDDTLKDRIKNSPTVGPLLEDYDVDADAFLSYMEELAAQAENQEGTEARAFDLKAALDRFEKGSQAKDNFKAAMEVTAGKSASFTIDGKEENCKGYDVIISKASMIDFLRTSSDFFLQDEELKKAYLKQLETTVKMSGIMGGSAMEMGGSADEIMQQGYDEMEKYIGQMIGYLDESLHDAAMTVYVDKKGRLAAVNGTTAITADDETVDVKFNWELQGGTYLTQNMKGEIVLTNEIDETITADFARTGRYDKKNLTYELNVNVTADQDMVHFVCKGDYSAEGGSYNISAGMTANEDEGFEITAKGIVDQLEKGKWIHVNLDELKLSGAGMPDLITLSGEFGIQPLSGPIEEPTGESLDILAATKEDWNSVVTEATFKLMAIAAQLGAY